MNIKINNSEIAELSQDTNGWVVDYGYKKWGYDLATNIEIDSQEEKLTFHPTCGCTTSFQKKTETGYSLTLKYDSKRKGNFSKIVKIMKANKLFKEIKLTGTIVS